MKKAIIAIIAAAIIAAGAYIGIGFYRIEHVTNEYDQTLITRQSEAGQLIAENAADFNSVVDMIIADDTDIHDYYFDDNTEITASDAFTALSGICNVVWARTNDEKTQVTFYQTAHPEHDGAVLLGYVCTIDESGAKVWSVTDEFPEGNRVSCVYCGGVGFRKEQQFKTFAQQRLSVFGQPLFFISTSCLKNFTHKFTKSTCKTFR